MKKKTIDEVAAAAGVSKSTISRYLNGNFQKMSDVTRNKIRQTIKELDYHPNRQAQMLKTKKSGLIGLVVADMANLYSAQLISGAGEIARSHNYQLLIMDSHNQVEQEHDSLKRLQDQAIEGLIIQPMSRESRNYQDLIGELPAVFVDRITDTPTWPFVGVDNYEATRHLGSLIVKRGYQHVVTISEPVAVSQARFDRVRGMREAVQEQDRLFELLEIGTEAPEVTHRRIKDIIESCLNTAKKSVIFASNSRLLMQVMQLIGELGLRIPSDIGLCGFDDWHWTALTNPPIASIEQDAAQIGREAMEMVMDQITQSGEKLRVKIIASTINVRGSI